MGLWMKLKCCCVACGCGSCLLGIFLHCYAIGWELGYLTPLYGLVCLVLLLSTLIAVDIIRRNPADSHTAKSLLVQYLVQTLLRLYGGKTWKNLMQIADNCKQDQETRLLDILKVHAHTEIGEKFGFEIIKDREEFRNCIALSNYTDYDDYIRRAAEGEENLITADKVLFFATSSGTTGKNKILPVTHYLKNVVGKKLAALIYYLLHQRAGLQLQKQVTITYRPHISRSRSGLDIGPVTRHMMRYFPYSTSPRCVFDIDSEQPALYVHALFALREPEVGHLEPLMATLMYSFWKLISVRWQHLCDDIEAGTLRDDLGLDSKVTSEIKQVLRPDPERAALLRREFTKSHKGLAKRIWLNLRSVRMLSTGAFSHYAEMLASTYLYDVPVFSFLHAASEGFFGFNISMSSSDIDVTGTSGAKNNCAVSKENISTVKPVEQKAANGRLHNGLPVSKDRKPENNQTLNGGILNHRTLDGAMADRKDSGATYLAMPLYGFLEFIPEDSIDQQNPETLFMEQLTIGCSYEIVMTSHMGLYRYRTGDVVKVVRYQGQCPVYSFQYRVGQILNLFWEKTTENVFYEAILDTATALGVSLVDYTALEDIHLKGATNLPIDDNNNPGRYYILFVEINKNGQEDYKLSDKDKEQFDRSLCCRFELYSNLRGSGSISPMQVLQVRRGAFLNLKARMVEKTQNTQFKMPRVLRKRELLQYVLQELM